MSTDFASLAFSLRQTFVSRGISVSLGHAQQLLARSFGYSNLAAYQASNVEPESIEKGNRLILDIPALLDRLSTLGIDTAGEDLWELFATTFEVRVPGVGVHGSPAMFHDYLHRSVAEVVASDATVAGLFGVMRLSGREKIHLSFDFKMEQLPEVGAFLEIAVDGYIQLTAESSGPDKPKQVDLQAQIIVRRLGKCLVSVAGIRLLQVLAYEPQTQPHGQGRANQEEQLLTHIGNISFGGKRLTREQVEEVQREFEEQDRKQEAALAALPEIRRQGEAALRRLMSIARGNTGQCRHVAAFLLGLYNGNRFKFDLTELRCVDGEIFDDCMLVLKMDFQPIKEVHMYFPERNALFEQLAIEWRIPDRLKLRQVIKESGMTNCEHLTDLREIREDYLSSEAV